MFLSFHIIRRGTTQNGIFNIAASDACSKKDFAFSIASKLSINLDWAQFASIHSVGISSADSLGLSCSKAEGCLLTSMPDLSYVTSSLVNEYFHDH